MNKTLSLLAFILILFLGACSKQKSIEDLVSIGGVCNHLEQFDKIAKENNSNRAVGTPGGIASKNYIKKILTELGLNPIEQNFKNRAGAQGCNLLVEIKGKSEESIIMIGAHYDSVEFGPGINDNASGVATVLEIISVIQENNIVPDKTLRFAFWDSEETGVEGSPAYYASLDEEAKKQIKAYINVDMIASKEGEITVSDTDGSTIGGLLEEYKKQDIDAETIDMLRQMYESVKFAEGSLQLEQLAKKTFDKYGFSVKEDIQFARNSDTAPFMENIPTLGVSVIKIVEEPMEDGGVAVLFAPCYHQACDDINNVDKNLLEICLKVISTMTQDLAISGDKK